MPNKTKSAGAASTSAKGKRSASNKRSQSDNSSNEDEEDSSDSESESEEEAEPLTSPRRGRNCAKKVPKAAKSAKRPKIEAGHTNELEDDDDDDDDEDEAAESSESDVPEQPSADSKKAPKRSTARGSKASSKQTKKKSSPKKKNNKGGKGVKKAKKDADSDADDEENEEEDANLTDHDDEEQAEQIVTDVEMEEEAADKGVEKTKKQTTGRGGQQQVKAKKATGKSTRASPSKQAAGSSKGKTSKGENKASSGRKSSAAKGASKKSANDQSDDDTEQSEQEEEEVAAVEGAGEQQPKQRQSHGKSSSANTKNKCDKSKSKSSSAGNASSTSSSAATSSTAACPVKDVYTFELSPVEVPSASFVLSSGQENKARVEDQNKTEQSETLSTAVNTLNAVTEDTGSTSANANTVVKGSFSPQIVSGSSSSPSSSSVNRDGPAFEPLRPDSYSLYEPSYGPNVSLSSLSQLSQSIGGGAGGPILLNHQQQSSLPPTSSLANSKCSINIKEEPREDSLQSPFRVAHPKASTSMHQTPPPVIGDHHSASQHYGVNFASSVNNKATHPRRLWSNASAGSLISSSSSSSSSPVQLAFGQCPPVQPPTPATPASLASYFTPSSSLPALSSPFYPPNSQDLIRRDLDSRILASTAADRNLLAASLGITPSVGAVVQHPQPQPPPLQQQQQSSSQTPFNHAPTSAMIPPAPTAPAAVGSPLIAPCSSASFVPSGSPYPLPPHLQNSQATFTPCVPTNRPTNQVQDLSAESPLRISSPASRSQSPREKPPMTSLKKGRWGSMHITIAHNIQLSMTGRSHAFPITGANNVPTATTPLAKSTPIISHSRPSSKGSVKTFEPHAVPHSVYAPRVSSPAKGGATAPMSLKSSQDAASTALVNSMRPASVASSTFNTTNYPPRFGTPTFGTPSMSAPPMLPGLFPSPIPSPMSFPGFLADSWARPPFPGAIPPPPTTPNSAVPPTRPSVPFSFADYYNNANSASSFLSAFAAGARPPGEAFFAAQNRQATPESNNKPTASTSSTSTGGSGGNSGNSSHKRKHENHEHGKERAHSSRHQNGDTRSERPSSHKKSKQNKSDSGGGSSASRTSATENGERSRSEMQNDFYNRKPSTSHESTRHSTPNFNLPISSSASSSPYPSPFFSGSHTAYPPAQSPSASEHQRYMEMMSISNALANGLPPPPLPSSSPSTNAFLSPQSGYNPATSRPLWPYGPLPPPGHPSPSSLMGSSMMADPFKSLTDISLRPGMVSHDRETLFSRYSLLNSSGGGASIFDKMSKEQLEKFDMLQSKPNQPSATATCSSSSSAAMRTSTEPAHSTSSRSTPTHRLHTAPPPAALPTLPPPLPPPPAPSSTAIAPPPAPSTPFPYGYLNPLNPFGAAGANPYLSQAPPPATLGHPSPFSASSAMLNGVDPITSLALSHHHHHHHPGSMPPLPPGLSAEQAQFLLPPPFGVPPPGSSAANMMNSFFKGNPSNR